MFSDDFYFVPCFISQENVVRDRRDGCVPLGVLHVLPPDKHQKNPRRGNFSGVKIKQVRKDGSPLRLLDFAFEASKNNPKCK